jgi:asparaginyl-tRNA synthetase
VLVEPATAASKIKIKQAVAKRGERVRIFGWVHRLRQQGGMTFIVLRDGSGYLQCVLAGDLVRPPLFVSAEPSLTPSSQSQTYDALTLTLESTIQITGVIAELPAGKTAPDNHELSADWWSVVGKAPGGDEAFGNKISEVCTSVAEWSTLLILGAERRRRAPRRPAPSRDSRRDRV